MRPVIKTYTFAVGAPPPAPYSDPVVLDIYETVFNVGINCIVSGTSTGLRYNIEVSLSDPWSYTSAAAWNADTANWTALTGTSNLTATAQTNITVAVRGVRINVTQITTGSATIVFEVVQGSK